MKAPAKTPLDRLAEATAGGGITLVLGAGVSIPRRIPGWGAVTRALWKSAFPGEALPALEGLPQAYPLALELCARALGPERFVPRLREELYRDVLLPKRAEVATATDTLALVARLIVQEQRLGGKRRLMRVITFNADDLLEQAVAALVHGPARVVKPIVRASQHPERGTGDQPIPVYHLHGYLPQNPRAKWHQDAPDTLVFTDAQYWAAVAEPLGFINRVMAFALHDTRCVFLGLSMADVNLMRWLAVRANEVEADKAAQFEAASATDARRAIRRALDRHFWLRPPTDDPAGFTARWLALRGVTAVPLESWAGPELASVLRRCFPV